MDESGVPKDITKFKSWLDTASYEQKKVHFEGLSEDFIAKHGEEANELRLCMNLH